MGTIKLIFIFAMLAMGVYVGAQIIPPYFANYQFQDSIETEAKLGTYSTKSEDAIRDNVFKRAQELEIPVAKDQIQVQRNNGASTSGGLYIGCEYVVHVDLPGYPLDLTFHPESKNKSVY
jgi:hypothetical protein